MYTLASVFVRVYIMLCSRRGGDGVAGVGEDPLFPCNRQLWLLREMHFELDTAHNSVYTIHIYTQ